MLYFPPFFIYLFIYFQLHWVVIATRGHSLIMASRGHPCWGAWASPVAERRLYARGLRSRSTRTQQLWHTALVALQHVESSPDQGLSPCTLHPRQILIHCATREIPLPSFKSFGWFLVTSTSLLRTSPFIPRVLAHTFEPCCCGVFNIYLC